jgi:hypothetical protein
VYTSTLTILASELTRGIDKGATLEPKKLERELDLGNDIFAFLEREFPGVFDFSLLTQIDKEFCTDNFSDIHFAVGPGKFGIKNNGVAMLLAYTIELIQRERFVLRQKGFEFQLEINPSYFKGRNDKMV